VPHAIAAAKRFAGFRVAGNAALNALRKAGRWIEAALESCARNFDFAEKMRTPGRLREERRWLCLTCHGRDERIKNRPSTHATNWPTKPIAAGGIKKAGPETHARPPPAGRRRILPFAPKALYTHVVHVAKVIRQNSAVLRVTWWQTSAI
jgi:hypothetical protein